MSQQKIQEIKDLLTANNIPFDTVEHVVDADDSGFRSYIDITIAKLLPEMDIVYPDVSRFDDTLPAKDIANKLEAHFDVNPWQPL